MCTSVNYTRIMNKAWQVKYNKAFQGIKVVSKYYIETKYKNMKCLLHKIARNMVFLPQCNTPLLSDTQTPRHSRLKGAISRSFESFSVPLPADF